MIYSLSLVLLSVIVSAYLWLLFHRNKCTHFKSPGSVWMRWSPFGHIFYVTNLRNKYPELSFFDVTEIAMNELGTDVMVYFFFHISFVIVTNVDIARNILSDHQNFLKPNDTVQKTKSILGMRTFGEKSLLTDVGTDNWHRKRKILDPAFSKKFLRSIFADINSVTDDFIVYLEKKNTEELDIFSVLGRTTLQVVFQSGFGIIKDSINDEKCIFSSAITALGEILEIIFFNRFTYRLPWNFNEEKNNYKKHWLEIRATLNEHAMNRITNKDGMLHNHDILGHIIEANDTMEDIVDDFVVFMVAGMETTTNTLTFVIHYLLKNPDIYLRVREEVDAVCGGEVGYDQICSGLVYMEQVIKETQRISPTGVSTSREPSKDMMVEGYLFPKGLIIMIPQYLIQRKPEYWSDPLTFDPDRFGPGKKIASFTYMPFMAGPRGCIGRHFAMLEMKIILLRLIRTFELIDPNPDQSELRTEINTTMKPKNGMPIILRKRQL